MYSTRANGNLMTESGPDKNTKEMATEVSFTITARILARLLAIFVLSRRGQTHEFF